MTSSKLKLTFIILFGLISLASFSQGKRIQLTNYNTFKTKDIKDSTKLVVFYLENNKTVRLHDSLFILDSRTILVKGKIINMNDITAIYVMSKTNVNVGVLLIMAGITTATTGLIMYNSYTSTDSKGIGEDIFQLLVFGSIETIAATFVLTGLAISTTKKKYLIQNNIYNSYFYPFNSFYKIEIIE